MQAHWLSEPLCFLAETWGLELIGFSVFTCTVIIFLRSLLYSGASAALFASTTSFKFLSNFTIRARRVFSGVRIYLDSSRFLLVSFFLQVCRQVSRTLGGVPDAKVPRAP